MYSNRSRIKLIVNIGFIPILRRPLGISHFIIVINKSTVKNFIVDNVENIDDEDISLILLI